LGWTHAITQQEIRVIKMRLQDFEDYAISDFRPWEIARVGTDLKDVQVTVFVLAQKFRDEMDRRVKIISLTGGEHKPGSYHYLGRAMDFVLYLMDGPVDIYVVFKAALLAGFNGIGIYWNGKRFSFHVDTRSHYTFWCGHKKMNLGGERESKWTYIPLTLDADYLKSL